MGGLGGGGGGGVGGGGVGAWRDAGVGGGGGKGGFFPKEPLCPAKPPMVHEFTQCGWPKAAGGPPPTPPFPPIFGAVRRERGRFSPPFPIQHAARVGGP